MPQGIYGHMHLGAFLARFRQPDRDGLFPARDAPSFAAFARLVGPGFDDAPKVQLRAGRQGQVGRNHKRSQCGGQQQLHVDGDIGPRVLQRRCVHDCERGQRLEV